MTHVKFSWISQRSSLRVLLRDIQENLTRDLCSSLKRNLYEIVVKIRRVAQK